MKKVTGWGSSHSSQLDPESKRHIPRGNGQAYNDASTLDKGAWRQAPKSEPEIEPGTFNVTVGAGMSVSELLSFLALHGRTLDVVPGSGWASVGGMVAAEVHGKNHHRTGTISGLIVSFVLESPSGTKVVSRTNESDLFFATIGGMGLTGLITTATLKTSELKGSKVLLSRTKVKFDNLFEVLVREAQSKPLGAVASIDAYSRVALVESGSPIDDEASPEFKVREIPAPSFLRFNRFTVRAANFLRYGMREKALEKVTFAKWFYPLSSMPHWTKYHGRNGLWQYQFSIVDSPENRSFIISAIGDISTSSTVTLSTLKYLGDGTSEGMLGFTQKGWTLAMDICVPSEFKKREKLKQLLHDMDAQIASRGGRLYLTKDARALPSVIEKMYPNLTTWRHIVNHEDPDSIVDSDLSRRVGLRKAHVFESSSRLILLGGNSTIAKSIANVYESKLASEDKGLTVFQGVRNPSVGQHHFDASNKESFSILNRLETRSGTQNVIVVAAGTLSDGFDSKTVSEDPSWGVVEATAGSYESLKAAGGGTLIVLSSGGIAVPRAGRAIYVAGKAALDSYTRGLMEVSQADNIDILLVRPSFVYSEMTKKLRPPKDAIRPIHVARLTVDALSRGGNQIVWTPRMAAAKYLVALILPGMARKVLNKNHVEIN
jgi:decaprenylphospho-beta-D-ribofuranose 2-oxidase